jgi:NAD(P)H-flavin reductase/hemoglobin-like flavoprotein
VAITLDGGGPDYGAERPAGQSRLGIFKRQRDSSLPEQTSLTQDYGGRHARALDVLAGPPMARTESIAAAQEETGESVSAEDFDARLVKESFAHMMANSPLAMEYFYSHLFISSPETRGMFPLEMSQLREHVFAALARLVWTMDSPEASAAYLRQLGRDHRKYGVKDKHYHAFFAALLETVTYFNGTHWTPETQAAWAGALAYAARMMRTAAAADAEGHPPWWVGEIVEHDRRSDTVAVVTIRPDGPLPYRPGQYLPVQVTRWPRVWRSYSIANAPRADGLIDLHVRAVPGGMVSTALVRHAAVGDTVLLGPAGGEMTVPDNDRDLLCVAGGTGLAPIKALIKGAARRPPSGRTRKITLFVGARSAQDLYDLADLRRLQSAFPGLQVIPVLSGDPALSPDPAVSLDPARPADPAPPADPALPGEAAPPGALRPSAEPGGRWLTGLLPDVVRGHSLFENSEAYICGPEAMVRQAALLLTAHIGADRIHHDALPDDHLFGARPDEPDEPVDFSRSPLFAKFARPGFPPDALR